MMENAYLPNISILLQYGGKILALLCPDDSIQICMKDPNPSETKLEGFVSSHRGITELTSSPQIAIRC